MRFDHNSFSFVQLKLLREAFLMFKALATEISFALIFAYLLLIISTFSLMRTPEMIALALATELSFALIFAYLLLIISTFSLMRTHKRC